MAVLHCTCTTVSTRTRLNGSTHAQALEALPEPLLLRVLRAWPAPLSTQLAALPRRLHPAAVAAAHPSVDSSRSLCLDLPLPPFRRALRAAAALASMGRIDTITLVPPSTHSSTARSTPEQRAASSLGALHFALSRLRCMSAVTSLQLTGSPLAWLTRPGICMHRLSCIAAMPHLRAVGFGEVTHALLPELVSGLTGIRQLEELALETVHLPGEYEGVWGAAAIVRELSPLTMLRAVRLKLKVQCGVCSVKDAARVRTLTTLLRSLVQKRVTFDSCRGFTFVGQRRPADVLGALRVAAPQLDYARCSVEESGEGSLGVWGPTIDMQEEVWTALMAGGDGAPAVGVNLITGLAGVQLYPRTHVEKIPPQLVGALPGLEALKVPRNGQTLDVSSAAALGRELHALTRLTRLELTEVGVVSSAAALLLPRLAAVTSLRALELGANCMGERGAAALAAGLPRLAALTALLLFRNEIGGRGAEAVLAALAPAAAAGLVRFHLGRNRIGLRGAAAVAVRLPEMTSLQELNLDANDLVAAEAVETLMGGLVEGSARLSALTYLNLERNFLECAGAAALARTLPRFPRLQVLTLRAAAIGHVGMRALVLRLPRMPCLTHVVLEFNCIGNAGTRALAHMLYMHQRGPRARRAPRPKRIAYNLEHNGIGDAGALALADAVLGPYERCDPPYAAHSAQRWG